LECTGFRCLRSVCLEPGAGLTIIRGGNAQGKTSLLEAILFAVTARSHRTTRDAELANYKDQCFRVVVDVARNDRTVSLEASWRSGAKRFKVNGVAQVRVSDILGQANVVLYAPEDITLVRGSAVYRRRFLDIALSQLSPPYLNALQQYRHALRQRNELLRSDRPEGDLIAVWDSQLARHGAVLRESRAEFTQGLAVHTKRIYAQLAEAEAFALRYAPDVPLDERMDDVLAKRRLHDVRRGTTTHGPHRDDVEMLIEDQPARAFGSQGQQKTAALALKLAEVEVFRTMCGEHPILMLDEALAELDGRRARRVFETVDSRGQCIVTTTDMTARSVPADTTATWFEIEGGRLEKG
jgi:DNA replication and repair protein RecF